MLEIPSSDGIEILSDSHHPVPSRPRPNPTRPSSSNTTLTTTSDQRTTSRNARSVSTTTKQLANVIELSDGSEDEGPPLEPKRTVLQLDDDDVVVIEGPNKSNKRTISAPAFAATSSDDLPPLPWNQQGIATTMGRSASMAIASTSRNVLPGRVPARANTLNAIPDIEFVEPSSSRGPFSSSPFANPIASTSRDKGKGKQQEPLFNDDFDVASRSPSPRRRRATTAEDDPWKSILGDDDDEGTGGKKKKGKGKEKVPNGRRKRLMSDDGGSETEEDLQNGTTKRKSPVKKAPRLSADDAKSKKEQVAAERTEKAALKKKDTADRLKLREANVLKTKDKSLTAAELTVHVSGTAFGSLERDPDEDDEDDNGGSRRGRKKKKKEKPSPWLEITEKLEERMFGHKCAVERPEIPRRDVGCEGAIRWTRTCDVSWNQDTKIYEYYVGGEKAIVEEPARLVFLTAHELSLHVSRNTLSSYMSKLQAQLPDHVDLFVVLFGLQSIFRDIERVRQAEYRNSIRATAGESAGAAIKPAGIGEGQPTRQELELELMRMQVKSGCMIVSVDKVDEAVDWLEQISLDIGQKPFQLRKQHDLKLLGTGQATVPSGKDLKDTYIKMLSSLRGVTEAIAKGIVGEYPTFRSLLDAWETCEGGEKGKQSMLVGIGKGRNVNGTATHRAIGQALSANIYRMMTSRDPELFI